MEKQPKAPSLCPCPCRPRVEALEALVQEQGRQLAELNIRVQNAGMSFFCDISQILPPQNLNVPQVQVQQPIIVTEGTATAVEANEEKVTPDLSFPYDDGEGVPIPSVTITNITGATACSLGGNSGILRNAPPPTQSLGASANIPVDIKPILSPGGAIIQKAEVSSSKKKRGSGTVTVAKSGSTTTAAPATPTPAKQARKAKVKPGHRYRCGECTGSYFDQIGLTIHSRIHEKNIFGLGPDLKTCDRCGLQMLASESPTMHSESECQVIRENRVK